MLLVPSPINRFHVLDLTPQTSLVQSLLERDAELYLLDWGVPRDEDRFLEFDAVVEEILAGAVQRVLLHAGAQRAVLFGHCLGGTLCAIHAALHPEACAGLINMAGPIDFAKGGLLATWTDRRWFDPDLLVDAHGNLPAWALHSAFLWLVPTVFAAKVLRLARRFADPGYLRAFWALELWSKASVPFPGEAYRKYIRQLYQENRLVRGTLLVGGREVRLGDITCPVLVLTGDRDPVVPTPCATALLHRCGARERRHVQLPGGHIGILVGSAARRHLWPVLQEWLDRRAGA